MHGEDSLKRYVYSLINGQRRDVFALCVRAILLPFSWVYRFVVVCLRAAYAFNVFPRTELSVPVISIGNLTMGGSGKTPMAIFLAKLIVAKIKRPAVFLRGYKSDSKSLNDSDEQMMMRAVLNDVPVVANPNRCLAAKEIVERNQADLIILDDGFQHWKLQRNLDVVLIDCVNPFGNGQVIPAGILREPVSALKYADVVVLTKTDFGKTDDIREQIKRRFPKALVVETVHRPKSVTDIYAKQHHGLQRLVAPVIAFCAIGDPGSFKSTLLALGADVKEFVSFIDHHEYGLKDMQRIKDLCQAIGIRTLVTTGKDEVKLRPFQEFWKGFNIYSLNIEIEMTKGFQEFSQRIAHVLDC